MTDSALVAAVNRLATAVEQNTLALLDTRAPSLEPLVADAGLPMGDEEPPLPTAPPYVAVPGQFPPISGPVVNAPPQPQAQVVSPIPPQPAGLCPEHRVPWSKFVEAGVSKRTGRAFGAFWACPATGCNQKPPR